MTVPLAELVELAAAVIAAGIVTGLLAGLFGIGGGAVIVPVLFELFRMYQVPEEVRMQLCVGTSLAIIIPTAWRSYQAHQARGLVVPEVLRLWTVPVILGVAAGSLAAAVSSYVAPIGARRAHRLPRRWLEIGFGLFLLTASARFVLSLLYPGT